ncbi:MinD/ParA family ATP-binding protein [Nocardia transvalensis]|nr:MinD/ParA family protein [Nocardia transvalensis]
MRVTNRPDLPPPPERAQSRPPLPEPPGPGEAAPAPAEEPAPQWLGGSADPRTTGESAAIPPGPDAPPARLSPFLEERAPQRAADAPSQDDAAPQESPVGDESRTAATGPEVLPGDRSPSFTDTPSPRAPESAPRNDFRSDSPAPSIPDPSPAQGATGTASTPQPFASRPSTPHEGTPRPADGAGTASPNFTAPPTPYPAPPGDQAGTGTAATGFTRQPSAEDVTQHYGPQGSGNGPAPIGDPQHYSPQSGGNDRAPVGDPQHYSPQGDGNRPAPVGDPQQFSPQVGGNDRAPVGDPQHYGPQSGGNGRAPVGDPPVDPRYAAPAEGPAQGGQWQSPAPEQQWGGQPQPPQYQPPQQYQQPPQYPQGMQPSLDDVPVRRAKKAPGSGWRRAVHHMSGGSINPGMSAEERRLQELVARIRQPVRGDYRIAVLSLKGGVGKTTTTMGIGSIFASVRGDRVIAVDANPDFGTLSQRVPLQTRSTVRDLLLDQAINSYGDVRRHTSQATSRLEVLASERDPAASESFSEDEYRRVARVLQRYYNIILTDCGTGLMHSAMAGVLDLAHSLVLISSSAIDGARSAAATLDWLSLHGHDHLVRNAVVVINLPRPGSPNVGIQQLREYFLSRCRAVHIIPYDPHLSEGAEIDLARLHKNTKRALVELAATVADDFATDHRRFYQY